MSRLNPYEAPGSMPARCAVGNPRRDRAVSNLRWVLGILLAPALYNYYAFDQKVIAGAPIPDDIAMIYRAVNITGFVAGSVAFGWLGMTLLEGVAEVVRRVTAPAGDRDAWLTALYASLGSTPWLALGGAVLWGIWVYAFYTLNANFHLISYAVGIPAHVLAACWYLPLFVRWYRLRLAATAA